MMKIEDAKKVFILSNQMEIRNEQIPKIPKKGKCGKILLGTAEVAVLWFDFLKKILGNQNRTEVTRYGGNLTCTGGQFDA